MRTFKHFPEHSNCLICGTNDDKETVLVPIVGTQEGHNIQATPVHTDCISDHWIYSPKLNAIIIPCAFSIP